MESTAKTKTNNSSYAIFMTVLVAMFAAVGAVTSWISIPMPVGVPITLQTFGMALIGYTLGYKYGALSVLVYVALGAVGVPVFSNFKMGLGVLLGMTGGYILGFIPMAFICGLNKLVAKKIKNKVICAVLSVFVGMVGLLACHLCGIVQISLVSENTLLQAAAISSGFIIKDIVSVIAAYFVSLAAVSLIEKISKRKI